MSLPKKIGTLSSDKLNYFKSTKVTLAGWMARVRNPLAHIQSILVVAQSEKNIHFKCNAAMSEN